MRNKKLIIIFSVLCALAVVIVLSSVLFSVQHVYASCYNDDVDTVLDQKIVDSSKIRRGKSIFTLKKRDVISKVENSVENINVINVEKKFPNSVYINYVKLFEYFEYEQNGQTYYISNDGRIIGVDGENDSKRIKLYTRGKAVSPEIGESFVSDNDFDNDVFSTVTSVLERLGTRAIITNLFEFIDFGKDNNYFIYFKTRTGVVFELQSLDNALEKLRLGVSVYSQFAKDGSEKINSGTIIMAGDKAYYDAKDRYEDGI